MAYNLGAVGFGHWFERLYAGMVKTNQITLAKVIGVSGIEGKAERLRAAGLKPENYYKMDPEAPLPEAFFEGLDIVHISDPNKYHAQQTMQSLGKGKITITEKTWGINKAEFYKVLDYAKKNNQEAMLYLHLHYLHKLLTMELPGLLRNFTQEHGKVSKIAMTFFEQSREEDLRRSGWLFAMENGGLFMDWIHPFEILYAGAKASKAELTDVMLYATKPEYDLKNPTGIHATVSLSGEFFEDGAIGDIRVAKGMELNKKAVRITFEDAAHLELAYMDSDKEASTGMRGSWVLNDHGSTIESCARGPETSEFFVSDILRICTGEQAGPKIELLEKIFSAQWAYQEMQKGKPLHSSKDEVALFQEEGVTLF